MKHISNIDFYLNYYLTYFFDIKMEDGMDELNYFFSYWFIHKALWSSIEAISLILAVEKIISICVNLGMQI